MKFIEHQTKRKKLLKPIIFVSIKKNPFGMSQNRMKIFLNKKRGEFLFIYIMHYIFDL